MRFAAIATAVSLAGAASAANILVKVGDGNALVFNPAFITAAQGDTISFQFLNKNHSVTQSTFAKPCERQSTPSQGITSGFQPVAADAQSVPQWSFTVNNATAPLWFFCGQTNPVSHCQKGMVFSVNAPTTGNTHDKYVANAMGTAAAAGGASASGGAPGAGGASGGVPDSGAAATGGNPSVSGDAAGAQPTGAGVVNRANAAVLLAAGLLAGLLL
jgi:hypothetical protein